MINAHDVVKYNIKLHKYHRNEIYQELFWQSFSQKQQKRFGRPVVAKNYQLKLQVSMQQQTLG